jgi:hypothetical protein
VVALAMIVLDVLPRKDSPSPSGPRSAPRRGRR